MFFSLFGQSFARFSGSFALNAATMQVADGFAIDVALNSGKTFRYSNVTYFDINPNRVIVNSDVHSQGVTWQAVDVARVHVIAPNAGVAYDFEKRIFE